MLQLGFTGASQGRIACMLPSVSFHTGAQQDFWGFRFRDVGMSIAQ